MTRTITLLRRLSVAMALFVACACSAGQAAIPDPCIKARADGQAITKQDVDQTTQARALAQHIIDNATCYDSQTVAVARTGLVQLNQPTPPPPSWLTNIGQ